MASKNKDPQAERKPAVSDEMPVVPHRVLHSSIPIYNDEDCRERAPGHIVIVEALDPEDDHPELDILPTTKEYQVGQLTHFQTDHHRMWDKAWFLNPITNQVEVAWKVGAAEFVGPLIDEATLAKESDYIAELDRRMSGRRPDTKPIAETVN